MLTIIAIISIIVIYFYYYNMGKPQLYPPGPFYWPYIGNLISVWLKLRSLKYHHTVWQALSRQYGSVLGLRLGFINVVVVSGKDMIREVTSRDVFDGRPDGFFYTMRSFGKKLGLVFSDGKSWRYTRQVALKYLKNFGYGTRSMEYVIAEECKALADLILEDGTKPILVNNMFDVSIINILWRIISGKRYDLKDNTPKRLCQLINRSFKVVDMSGGILNFLPFLRHIFPGYTGYRELKDIHNELYKYISETIQEHRHTINVNNPRDVIDAFLTEMMNQEDEMLITEEELQVVCLDLLEAGTETVSNTMVFLLLYVVLNKEVQLRIHQEIDHVIGQDRLPSLSDKNRYV